ncbi:MAG: fumarate hydratase [Coprobacillus cateniformis]
MREINQETIIEAVKQLCIEANSVLPCDVRQALKEAYVQEDSSLSRLTLEVLNENADIAQDTNAPICQDTGMACVFVEMGRCSC